MAETEKTALVLGANGLIGKELVQVLLRRRQYQTIRLLVRRQLGVNKPGCEEHVVDFDRLHHYPSLFQVNDVFCCLGTTIKKAKSREAFRKVDLHYPLEAARLAKQAGVRQFLIVTAMGANPQSPIFYNRVKGEVEEALQAIGFPSLQLFRPSLLLGERSEFRLGERAMATISPVLHPLLVGPLRPYRAIKANTVARAMAIMAQTNPGGVAIYPSDKIEQIAQTQ
jgi:uncharacterized protein YbjT (DUF2867 family)